MSSLHDVGVGVFVFDLSDVNQSRFLLGQRGPECKRGAGCWALPGGMVSPGESVIQAALREVKEETGLDVRPYSNHFHGAAIPGLVAVTDLIECRVHPIARVTLWIATRYFEGAPRVLEKGKCNAWVWHSLAEVSYIPGATDPFSEQYQWTPYPMWQRFLLSYLPIPI